MVRDRCEERLLSVVLCLAPRFRTEERPTVAQIDSVVTTIEASFRRAGLAQVPFVVAADGGSLAPCGSWAVAAGAPYKAPHVVYAEPLGGFDTTPFAAETAAALRALLGLAKVVERAPHAWRPASVLMLVDCKSLVDFLGFRPGSDFGWRFAQGRFLREAH